MTQAYIISLSSYAKYMHLGTHRSLAHLPHGWDVRPKPPPLCVIVRVVVQDPHEFDLAIVKYQNLNFGSLPNTPVAHVFINSILRVYKHLASYPQP